MVALHTLSGAVAEVYIAPRREEGGKCTHEAGWRAGAAEGRRNAREARIVAQPLSLHVAKLVGNRIQRLIPRDGNEAGVLISPFLRVRALHRLAHAVRIVGFLHQPVGLDAGRAAAGMFFADIEIRLDADGDVVLDLDLDQVRAGRALETIGWNIPYGALFVRHWPAPLPFPPPAILDLYFRAGFDENVAARSSGTRMSPLGYTGLARIQWTISKKTGWIGIPSGAG